MGGACYRHEMTDDDHVALLKLLLELEGMVVLSGYPHDSYNDLLRGWRTVETSARMAAGRGAGLTEVLWLSPNIGHSDLFRGVA